jgi:hypothetical protein
LVNAPKEAMEGLLSGLGVAFDTTALALSLSIMLMFTQFLVRQVETQLLAAVDRQSTQEMIGRFQQLGTRTDPHLASVQSMSERVIQSVEQLVNRQASIWKTALEASQHEWRDNLGSTQATIEKSLAGALSQSISGHADALLKAEEMTNQRTTRQSERLHKMLTDSARAPADQQTELAKQGQVLLKAVEATADVVKLEQALNKNLAALAGAKNFEDTVMSLSAAIHLLNSRLGIASPRGVKLVSADSEAKEKERAA